MLFKDASANKGGVTSSSLEVLAGLALADEDYIELMTASGPDGAFNDFYGEYVATVQRIICRNAAAEFAAIWQESIVSKKPRCVLTDEIGRLLVRCPGARRSLTSHRSSCKASSRSPTCGTTRRSARRCSSARSRPRCCARSASRVRNDCPIRD